MTFLAWLLTLIGGPPPFAPTASPWSSAPSSSVCLLRDDGLLLAPVYLNGEGPFLFLVDTAGTHTLVSHRLGARLRLRAAAVDATEEPARRIESLGRSRAAVSGLVDELRVDDERFVQAPVLLTALSALRALDPRIEGVLGQDLLGTRHHMLDYASGRLRFDADGAIRRSLSGIPVPLAWSHRRPMLTAVTGSDGVGERRRLLRLVLDSAATHAVLLDDDTRPDVRALARRERPEESRRLTTHGGDHVVPLLRLDRLVLPTAILDEVEAVVTPLPTGQQRAEDGLLPTRLFSALYFDADTRTVLLNPVRKTRETVPRATELTVR